MPDLIDRKELLNSRVYSTRSGKPNYEKMLKNLVNDILTAPTVDTERHAHWLYRSTNRFYECSYCGNITYSSEDKYCSNCGCGMDKVKDETQNN